MVALIFTYWQKSSQITFKQIFNTQKICIQNSKKLTRETTNKNKSKQSNDRTWKETS